MNGATCPYSPPARPYGVGERCLGEGRIQWCYDPLLVSSPRGRAQSPPRSLCLGKTDGSPRLSSGCDQGPGHRTLARNHGCQWHYRDQQRAGPRCLQNKHSTHTMSRPAPASAAGKSQGMGAERGVLQLPAPVQARTSSGERLHKRATSDLESRCTAGLLYCCSFAGTITL